MFEVVTPTMDVLAWVFGQPTKRAAIVSPWISGKGMEMLRRVLSPKAHPELVRLDVCLRPRQGPKNEEHFTHFPSLHAWLLEWMTAGRHGEGRATIRISPSLHAKLYLTDERALVCSSNLTGAGFGGTFPRNVELGFRTDDLDSVADLWRQVEAWGNQDLRTTIGIETLAGWADISGLDELNIEPRILDRVSVSWAERAYDLVADGFRGITSVEFVRSLYGLLVDAAGASRYIYYVDLAKQLGFRLSAPEEAVPVWNVLRAISAFEHSQGHPLLSAIVVGRNTNTPGPGFLEMGRRLGAVRDGESSEDFVTRTQVEVFRRHHN